MRGKKAQLSAELIIIIAAVLAVALILVVQLQSMAKEGKNKLKSEADKIFDEIDETKKQSSAAGLKKDGARCSQSSECESDFCNPITRECASPP